MHSAKNTALIALMAITGFSMTASAAEPTAVSAAQTVVDDAVQTLQNFQSDSKQGWFRQHVSRARGVFIIPRLGKGGFIFAGSGGRGLAMARDAQTGEWSQPAFYTVGSASIGLQAGAQESEVIYLVMSDAGMSAMMGTKFQVGADGTVAAGPIGVGAQAATTDMLSFSRGVGLFGGISAEGTVIQPDFDRNNAYYGQSVSISEILMTHAVRNVDATQLVAKVSATAAPH
ncbi:MAG: lipid-binding SYLF domain-containing protein [Gammaproteobacteria bacterium]|nr:lipid-binding SYLF domain-containing protein [Gammaproteobacteria bacterium]MDX2461393.1 lipid-binding SYLF domain-containing protein [Gammaproteobacteria bacterium]